MIQKTEMRLTRPRAIKKSRNIPAAHAIFRETLESVQAALPDYTIQLREMCNISSPSNEPDGLKAMAAYLASRLERAGLKASILEDRQGDAVVAELIGHNLAIQPVLILGHHDTIYVQGSNMPPSTIEGTKFMGPGASDMKGGLLQAIYALEALQKSGYRDFSKIIFMSMPDEETEKVWMRPVLAQVCRDNRPFAFILECAQTVGNIVTQRKGARRFMLTAAGVNAHAGAEITKGRNAVVELAHQILQFISVPDLPEGMTINAGPIEGGTVVNVVPDHASALFDVRYFKSEDLDFIRTKWHEFMKQQLIPDVRLTLNHLGDGIPPMVSTQESIAVAERVKAIADSFGLSYHGEIRGGSSDGGVVSSLGVSVLDGFGAVGHQGHSPEEFIDLASVPQKAALLAATIAEFTSLQA